MELSEPKVRLNLAWLVTRKTRSWNVSSPKQNIFRNVGRDFELRRQGVLDVPWYFHGKKCVAWSFPQGTCLSVGRRGVYRSWEECRRRCVLRPESECDETPAAETGSPHQLRHPYFADMQAHGGARCVNVTRRALKSHHCLIGSNQFDSLDACR
ncbi:hypothetical protein MRX96_028261 [Rhipicephalus microplus]